MGSPEERGIGLLGRCEPRAHIVRSDGTMRNRLVLALAPAVVALASIAGCSDAAEESDSADLTSNSALARELSFQGRVFVKVGASDAEILRQVQAQTQTAFGPLRLANVAVNSRELKGVDPTTFKKRDVKVVDVAGGGEATPMTEVSYVYTDDAVVDLSYAKVSTVPIALMTPGYQSQKDRIVKECTANDSHARDFASSAWYVFDPARPSCREAIRTEQAAVDADRAKLDPETEVPKSEVSRLYIPATAQLGADKTNRGESYPDYHRLYAGGVKTNTLVVSLVYGMIDHDNKDGPAGDYGYGEFMSNLDEVFKDHAFKLTKVGTGESTEGGKIEDVTTFKLPSGSTFSAPFEDLVKAKTGSSTPASLGALSPADRRELGKLVGNAVYKKWLTFERDVKVTIDGKTTDSKIEIIGYFGAESSAVPHKYAIKNSDVFLYNGHSSIGYGPLDPSRFKAEDFPGSYQILFIDGCVSYNYYEKDYIPLKQGGTQNLDLITNGIEAPAYRSGYALGRFVSTLLREDKPASYRELLTSAEATDSLRVVDGELDNEFSPQKTKLSIEGR